MTNNNLVVLNIQHKLLDPQIEALNQKFGTNNWEILSVPADGWTADQQVEILNKVEDATLVFCSPVPYLLMLASKRLHGQTCLFHNDKRVKQEVDDGKGGKRMTFLLAPDGWKII